MIKSNFRYNKPETKQHCHSKISRPKELFLLFWVDESGDSRRSIFEEACLTRYFNILYSPSIKKETQIVYHLSINTFNQIKEILEIFINKNGGI